VTSLTNGQPLVLQLNIKLTRLRASIRTDRQLTVRRANRLPGQRCRHHRPVVDQTRVPYRTRHTATGRRRGATAPAKPSRVRATPTPPGA
jgi:hypothetical protein